MAPWDHVYWQSYSDFSVFGWKIWSKKSPYCKILSNVYPILCVVESQYHRLRAHIKCFDIYYLWVTIYGTQKGGLVYFGSTSDIPVLEITVVDQLLVGDARDGYQVLIP